MTLQERYADFSKRLADERARLAQQEVLVRQLEGAVNGLAMVLADEIAPKKE